MKKRFSFALRGAGVDDIMEKYMSKEETITEVKAIVGGIRMANLSQEKRQRQENCTTSFSKGIICIV